MTDFSFFETLEKAPSTHNNFTLIERGNHEIPGVGRIDPLMSAVGTKTLDIRKVNPNRTGAAPQVF